MRIAYFDCFAGASGNMILGSLVDAGLDLAVLERELRRLPVEGWAIHAERVNKKGLAALYLDVHVPGEDGHSTHGHTHEHYRHESGEHQHEGIAHRRLADVLHILHEAHFSPEITARAEQIYRRLAQAEGRIHGQSAEEVVFHEVGQIDAIIDIAGAAIALHHLGIEKIYASALPCGTGKISSAHGIMPSPAPATMELLRGVPTYQIHLDAEFVTPTGASILSTIADFSIRPPMTIRNVGYGSGFSQFPFPNVLRVFIGESVAASHADSSPGEVVQLETNIDDMNPQVYEYVMERLFAAGALDAWTHAVNMKKGRPGNVLTALAPLERADQVSAVMLAETTSIGVRRWRAERVTLARQSEVVRTAFGDVRAKIVQTQNGPRARAEYEDCRRIAAQQELPLVEVMQRIEADLAHWLAQKK